MDQNLICARCKSSIESGFAIADILVCEDCASFYYKKQTELCKRFQEDFIGKIEE